MEDEERSFTSLMREKYNIENENRKLTLNPENPLQKNYDNLAKWIYKGKSEWPAEEKAKAVQTMYAARNIDGYKPAYKTFDEAYENTDVELIDKIPNPNDSNELQMLKKYSQPTEQIFRINDRKNGREKYVLLSDSNNSANNKRRASEALYRNHPGFTFITANANIMTGYDRIVRDMLKDKEQLMYPERMQEQLSKLITNRKGRPFEERYAEGEEKLSDDEWRKMFKNESVLRDTLGRTDAILRGIESNSTTPLQKLAMELFGENAGEELEKIGNRIEQERLHEEEQRMRNSPAERYVYENHDVPEKHPMPEGKLTEAEEKFVSTLDKFVMQSDSKKKGYIGRIFDEMAKSDTVAVEKEILKITGADKHAIIQLDSASAKEIEENYPELMKVAMENAEKMSADARKTHEIEAACTRNGYVFHENEAERMKNAFDAFEMLGNKANESIERIRNHADDLTPAEKQFENMLTKRADAESDKAKIRLLKNIEHAAQNVNPRHARWHTGQTAALEKLLYPADERTKTGGNAALKKIREYFENCDELPTTENFTAYFAEKGSKGKAVERAKEAIATLNEDIDNMDELLRPANRIDTFNKVQKLTADEEFRKVYDDWKKLTEVKADGTREMDRELGEQAVNKACLHQLYQLDFKEEPLQVRKAVLEHWDFENPDRNTELKDKIIARGKETYMSPMAEPLNQAEKDILQAAEQCRLDSMSEAERGVFLRLRKITMQSAGEIFRDDFNARDKEFSKTAMKLYDKNFEQHRENIARYLENDMQGTLTPEEKEFTDKVHAFYDKAYEEPNEAKMQNLREIRCTNRQLEMYLENLEYIAFQCKQERETLEEAKSDRANILIDKKNINQATQERMEKTPLNKYFKHVEIDDDVDLEKFGLFEKSMEKLHRVFPAPEDKPTLRMRKLGNYRALGMYVTGFNVIGVDFRGKKDRDYYANSTDAIQSFVHEYGHYLDYKYQPKEEGRPKENRNLLELAVMSNGDSLSMKREFTPIVRDYRKSFAHTIVPMAGKDAVAAGLTKDMDYFCTPTEVFARSFEIYCDHIGLKSELIKNTQDYKQHEYSAFTPEIRDKIYGYFDRTFPEIRPNLERVQAQEQAEKKQSAEKTVPEREQAETAEKQGEKKAEFTGTPVRKPKEIPVTDKEFDQLDLFNLPDDPGESKAGIRQTDWGLSAGPTKKKNSGQKREFEFEQG